MRKEVQENQQGIVSIMVTIIMMLVISLIVLGFSQVTRTNQREALDRQLGTQAYYAAESGVNAVVSALRNTLPTDIYTNNAYGTDCNALTAPSALGTATLNAANKVSYSCLLVDPHPTTITQSPLSLGANAVWPVISNDGTNIQTLTFNWALKSGATTTGTCNDPPSSLTPATNPPNTCNEAMLRVDLLKANDGSLPNGVAASAATQTFYFQPSTIQSGLVNSSSPAAIVQCIPSSSGCQISVYLGGVASSYYIRVTTMYRDTAALNISGTLANGSALKFKGAVATIDATGRAQDQVKRIKVVVPLTISGNNMSLPVNGLQTSGSICKYFAIAPGDTVATPASLCQ